MAARSDPMDLKSPFLGPPSPSILLETWESGPLHHQLFGFRHLQWMKETFTSNALGLAVDGMTLMPDGAGVVNSRTPISLGPSGDLQVGGSEVELATSGTSRDGSPDRTATGPAAAFPGGQNGLQNTHCARCRRNPMLYSHHPHDIIRPLNLTHFYHPHKILRGLRSQNLFLSF